MPAAIGWADQLTANVCMGKPGCVSAARLAGDGWGSRCATSADVKADWTITVGITAEWERSLRRVWMATVGMTAERERILRRD